MAVFNFDNPKVAVATKIREYYKTDKYLGGLIKITRTLHTEKMGQTINIYIPSDKPDQIYINGVEVVPKTESQE